MANFCILGSSFVRRLAEDIGSNDKLKTNFGLDMAHFSVSLHGVGGRTVQKIIQYDLGYIYLTHPYFVFLQVGSNDLSNIIAGVESEMDGILRAQSVALNIVNLAIHLNREFGARHICISQLLL